MADRTYHRPAIAAALLANVALLGCQVDLVDLGSNRRSRDAGADAGPLDLGPTTSSNCPYVTEAQVNALAGHPCDGGCTDALGPARIVESSAELVAVTAGRWRTCSGAVPWSLDAIGIEFQAGCTLFLLRDAPDGGVARGVTPDDQGTFNVNETSVGLSLTRTLELYFPTWSTEVRVTTSDCPHRMRLDHVGGGASDYAAMPSAAPPLQ